MKNFKEYWESNKVLLEPLGVSEAVAKKIWDDCCDVCVSKITEYYLNKL